MLDKYEIKITTPKNPLKCHNLLTDVKKDKIALTYEFALEFLQSTNNRKNIADFLELLNKKFECTPQEYMQYRPCLMALLSNREQPDSINQTISETALKYTDLKNAGKIDRDFFELLSHINLPKQQAGKVQEIYSKLCKMIPVNVNDIAEDVTRKIVTDGANCMDIAQFIVQELPEKQKKKNILRQMFNKIRGY